jgi:predicted SAM-dependent methyltransferase
MRLELGSGDRPTDGYVHLDVRPGADIVDDASTLSTIDDGSCEEIRAAHLLEHFGHRETLHILRVWWRKLAPGGRLLIEVPDLAGHIRAWGREQDDEKLVVYLFGEQDYPENTHRTMFTATTLDRALRVAGFRNIDVVSFGLVLAAKAYR